MKFSLPLRIDEPNGPRFELAIEQFKNGWFFVFRGTGFGLRETELEIRAPAQGSAESVDLKKAEAVIASANHLFQVLNDASEEFKMLVAKLPVRIVVLYDYGMGALELAEFNNGEFSWHDGYPKTGSAV